MKQKTTLIRVDQRTYNKIRKLNKKLPFHLIMRTVMANSKLKKIKAKRTGPWKWDIL